MQSDTQKQWFFITSKHTVLRRHSSQLSPTSGFWKRSWLTRALLSCHILFANCMNYWGLYQFVFTIHMYIQSASSIKTKRAEHSSIGTEVSNIDPAATNPKPAEPGPSSKLHHTAGIRDPATETNKKMKREMP